MSEVIIVSRSLQFREKCARLLSDENLQFLFAGSADELEQQLNSRKVTMVILKSGHDDANCRRLLDLVKEHHPGISVILSAEYFDFWSDFSTWAADACIVESRDLRELRSKVHEFAAAESVTLEEEEAFPVDWS